jgi:nitrogen regulatory protein P-II 1
MELKKITAIVRSDQLEELEERFKGPDLPGITVDHVHGYGEYANFFAKDWMSRYARVEIVADARQARRLVDVITDVVHTGTRGDGIVYVVPIEQLHRIRDRHTARSAQTCPRCRASARLRRRTRTKAVTGTRHSRRAVAHEAR